ncbi:NB-ARC domain-containing disease resistance protein, partial [Prunus dulcis]
RMAEAIVSFVLQRVGDFTTQEAKFLSGVSHQVEIRDAAYDLEDVIETYGLKVASKKKTGMKNVLKRFACIFKERLDLRKIGAEIENITAKISNLRMSLQSYNIVRETREIGGASSLQSFERQQQLRRTYSHVIERDVVGIEDNVKEIVTHLVKEESCLRVVSIWGMGGAGKTTLAKQIYHHKEVRCHFNSFAWVCISQQYQVRDVWEGILFKLISATKEQREEIAKMRDYEIAKKLFRVQQGKRCLVILDDIWSIETFNSLKAAFPLTCEETQSRILLTTRNEAVALHADRNGFLHQPQALNEIKSWELFEKIALFGRVDKDSGVYIKMKELGMEMLRHCAGLPLAITVLAGVLARKNTVNEWITVHANVYVYIRRGIGPEEEYADFEIPVKRLTQLWMAEGLVSLTQGQGLGEAMEDIAYHCLSELMIRCVVQVGETGSIGTIKTCRIHDLVRDLCLSKAEEENFLQVVNSSQRNEAISMNREAELPSEIGNMVHLRFLSLRGSNIKRIPASLGNLICLQTLDLRVEDSWLFIPNVIWKMKHTLYPVSSSNCDLNDLTGLTNLRKLSITLSSPLENLEEILKSTGSTLNHIRSLFVYTDLAVTGSTEQVTQIVSSCRHIYKLKLEGPTAELPRELHCFPNLTKLTLRRFFLKDDQMGIIEKLPNLTTLRLEQNTFNKDAKILVFSRGGFPHLQFLSLFHMSEVKEWRVEEGAMPSLRRLSIKYCNGLTTIVDGLRYLTTLRELSIEGMSSTFQSKLKAGGEDFHKIQHVTSLMKLMTKQIVQEKKEKVDRLNCARHKTSSLHWMTTCMAITYWTRLTYMVKRQIEVAKKQIIEREVVVKSMAEAVVSFVLESVRDFTIQEANFLSGVSHQVEVAQTELQLMQGFLKDADARQGQDATVHIWVAKIKDAAYDLEDVIQTYGFKVASKQKSGGVELHKIGAKIENITSKISNLRSSLQSYNIKEIRESGGESSRQLHERQRLLRRSYSHVVERDVVGLESNFEELVMHLVKDENRHQVVSIWGMGGLGKTTLAKQIYHNKKVGHHFDSFAWVCVSQRCQIRNVWEGILFKLISATKEQKQEIKEMTYDEIAKKLFRVMEETRCLVILDDIWSLETWNLLKVAFPNEKTESTILLTTRYQAVALPPNRNCFLHKLQPLNENASLELFEKIAIFGRADIDMRIYTKMRELGIKMLRHCVGLPLAIIVLAGVLSRKNTIKEWETVHENVHEYIRRGIGYEDEYEGASWVLALSYDHLPYHLKPCLLYLGHYSEDLEISVSTLTKLWVAEGLISLRQPRHVSGETTEEIARNCLSELVERQKRKALYIYNCYSLQENEATNPFTSMVAKAAPLGKVRRLSIYLDENPDRLLSSRYETNGHERSLLYFGLTERRQKSEKLLLSLLMNFIVLRVLKVEDMKVEVELPSEIGNIIHLRFLSVRTLDVLSTEYCDLKDVAGLTSLRKLNIKLANSVENLEEILKSAGSMLNRIRSLFVYIDYNSARKSSYEEQVRQIVSSCRHIYKLKLFGPTAELPKELHSYPNLAQLQLRRYGLKEDQMGILEKIPNLTTLRLINEAFEENTKILVFSKGGFPTLEFLFVYGMREITEWRVEEGAMPSLCRLHIEYCRGLTTLPDGLRYLTNLRELTITGMSKELHSRIQEDGEDFCKIQHQFRKPESISNWIFVVVGHVNKLSLVLIMIQAPTCSVHSFLASEKADRVKQSFPQISVFVLVQSSTAFQIIFWRDYCILLPNSMMRFDLYTFQKIRCDLIIPSFGRVLEEI